MFGGKESMKKTSVSVGTTEVKKNVHMANICGASLIDKTLVTTDLAGFIKTWKL
jgi:hypothetical protein